MFTDRSDVNIKHQPPYVEHESETRVYLPCLTKSSSRFLHDLEHIYEAIMLSDNRFFVKAYNKSEPFYLDLKTPFDRLNDERKTCRKMVCKVKQTEELTARELEWLKPRKQDSISDIYEDGTLVMVKHKFIAEEPDQTDLQ